MPRRFPPPWSVEEPDPKLGGSASSSATPTVRHSPSSTLTDVICDGHSNADVQAVFGN